MAGGLEHRLVVTAEEHEVVTDDPEEGTVLADIAPRRSELSIEVSSSPVHAFLTGAEATWQIVFLDPPYDLSNVELVHALEVLVPRLETEATVVLERSSRMPEPAWPEGLALDRRKDYGDTTLFIAEQMKKQGPGYASAALSQALGRPDELAARSERAVASARRQMEWAPFVERLAGFLSSEPPPDPLRAVRATVGAALTEPFGEVRRAVRAREVGHADVHLPLARRLHGVEGELCTGGTGVDGKDGAGHQSPASAAVLYVQVQRWISGMSSPCSRT